ncbi:MAG: hypothetical protein JRI83_14520, partial [Deltaproteobacteria bacterium]|nr:hypothetical protein [Deltaproteobacteria bacterium]
MADFDRVFVGAAPIARISMTELFRFIEKRIHTGEPGYVCCCEAHLCVRAIFDEGIRRVLEKAALVLPDGVSMSLGAKLLSKP